MKKSVLSLLIVLVSLLIISGCVQKSAETVTKETITKETTKTVKQPIPGVTKFIVPGDTSLGVPENKNLLMVLGNDGTASSDTFKVEIFEKSETGKVSVQLPSGEYYTIAEGEEKKIKIGLRTEEGTEKGSNVKFGISVTNDNEIYASGTFIVSI